MVLLCVIDMEEWKESLVVVRGGRKYGKTIIDPQNLDGRLFGVAYHPLHQYMQGFTAFIIELQTTAANLTLSGCGVDDSLSLNNSHMCKP